VHAVARGLPLHSILAGHDWRSALELAGEHDVAIVILTRTDPWVFGHLPAKRRILDAIDSATLGMRSRASAAPLWARLFWKSEAARCAKLERSAGARYDRIVTVTREDLEPFGGRGEVVPIGVKISPAANDGRTIDFGFWGRLAYFANEQAVRSLAKSIWPRIRAHKRDATLLIGGADAPRWIRALDGRDGIRVVSPMKDRQRLLRSVRVALLPIEAGSGQSIKTLEAAEAGCAIAGTKAAFRGCGGLPRMAVVEDDLPRLAELAVGLLGDENGRANIGAALREHVIANFSREKTLAEMRRVATEW
jgi:hypothetical protein